MTKYFGDLEKRRGWFAHYDRHWDEHALGPRPRREDGSPVRAEELVQRDAEGFTSERAYHIEGGYEYRNCPTNPYWRQILKRYVRRGIDLGLDGFMVFYAQREDCICVHCVARFKQHLRERYSANQLRSRFGIADLDRHEFDEIKGCFDPGEESPIRLESLKFSQLMLWECEREVFIDHGRLLKPDLLIGLWNHMYRNRTSGPGQIHGTFAALRSDERCVLPTELWARGEDLVWYSIGT